MVQPGVSAFGKKNKTTVLPRKSFSDTGFSFSSGKVKSGALSLTSMAISPLRSRLYRRSSWAVICLLLILGAPKLLRAQSGRSATKSKGPRATALLQLPENGKARLIPVCILVEGQFFDAGIYKANPVPMALEGGTVYEAQRTGQPIGLFTVKEVLQQQQTKAWIAEGDWEAAGSAPKKSTALQAEAKPREEEDHPPTLRRPGKTAAEGKSTDTKPEQKPADSKPAEGKPAGTTSAPSAPQTAPSGASTTSAPNTPSAANSTPPPTSSAPETAEENDPNRPHLRRGIPPPRQTAETSSRKTSTTPAPKTPSTSGTAATAAKPSATSTIAKTPQLIPAISDADGPEPRPYTFDMKPEEEQTFRKKMLALAATEVAKQAKQSEPLAESSTSSRRSRSSVKPAPPNFEDVKLRVFDVATNNEPILVLSAKATLPQSAKAGSEAAREYYVTVVARSDFNGELRKLLSSVTDNQHLDVTARLELIDAVDADGDGRGELLFREVSDVGSAYVVYRVTPDQLWTLFEGSPR